jgi:competence protein ComEA
MWRLRRNEESEAVDDLVRERYARLVGSDPPVPSTVEGVDRRGPRHAAVDAERALAAFDPGRRGVRALVLVAVVVLAGAGYLAWRARPDSTTVPPPVVSSADAPVTGTLVVAVAGRVRRPGLVRLPPGSRVADAIEAAGGALPGTDLSYLNLARKLVDGELVLIGVTPPPGVAPAGVPGSGLLNLNTATLAELDALPGVGPVLAQRIVDYRTKRGGFRAVNDLRQVDGIGESRYAELSKLVTV